MKKMKWISLALIAALFFSGCNTDKKSEQWAGLTITDYADSINAGLIKADTVKKSVKRVALANNVDSSIAINYYSPGVRGRQIFGGLVPYNEVWVTGAHSATNILFAKEVSINDRKIAAGKYALFTIPGRNKWTVILNKNYQQHLADDYNPAEDVFRTDIEPAMLDDTIQRLTYTIQHDEAGSGYINMGWEKVSIAIPFKIIGSTHSMSPGGQQRLQDIKTDHKRDVVCFMPVTAGITDTATFQKKLYGFCSRECRALFAKNPKQYVEAAK